jgi:hypothetical protein
MVRKVDLQMILQRALKLDHNHLETIQTMSQRLIAFCCFDNAWPAIPNFDDNPCFLL